MQSVYRNILDQIPFQIVKEYCDTKKFPQYSRNDEEEVEIWLKKNVLKYRNPNFKIESKK